MIYREKYNFFIDLLYKLFLTYVNFIIVIVDYSFRKDCWIVYILFCPFIWYCMKKYTLISFLEELHKIMFITQLSYEHITSNYYSFGLITRDIPASFNAYLDMGIIKDCTIHEHSYFNTHYYIINFNKDFSI